jgi:GH15 family glucan-1,4-alpha-glucosidase
VLLRLHQTPSGAILSGVESAPVAPALPEYRWCWHRDAAVAADALGRAGYVSATRRYLDFSLRSSRESGSVPAVVDPSGMPAAAADGLEGPALLLRTLARHFDREGDCELVGPFYRELAVPIAARLAGAADTGVGLPFTEGRWEGREGCHAVVAAAARGGLLAAARLARAFGDRGRAGEWASSADRLLRAMAQHLYRADWGRLARALVGDGRALRPDRTLDASLLLVGLLGEIEPEDPRIRATTDAVRHGLWVRTGVGGLARFERDPLGAVGTAEIVGTPWIETTLWLAWHAVRTAKRAQDLDVARTLLLWCAARAEGMGCLPEQLHPYRGATTALSPSPAAHAWYVQTVIDYVESLRQLKRCERCGSPAPARAEPAALESFGPSLPGLVRHLD